MGSGHEKGYFSTEEGYVSRSPEDSERRDKHTFPEDNFERKSTFQHPSSRSWGFFTTYNRLLKQDLEFKKLLSVWVPHSLSQANKNQREECCTALIKLFNDHGYQFLASHLLVQDENWVFWDSDERREVWEDPTGKRYSTPRRKLTNRKTMVLVAFTCLPKRVNIQILNPGTTATKETMIEFLRGTGKLFNNLKKDKIHLKEMMTFILLPGEKIF